MAIEYQIELVYSENGKTVHDIARYKTEEVRNEIYKIVCMEFANQNISIGYLSKHDGIQVSTYNYNDIHHPKAVAQFVPTAYFEKEAIPEIINIVKSRSLT